MGRELVGGIGAAPEQAGDGARPSYPGEGRGACRIGVRKLVGASAFIDRLLTEDRQAPEKQRHTARRIWQRLCAELPGFTGSERTVRC